MAPIKIFTLGNTGVVIDQSTLNPAIPEDALSLAQNTTHDPRLGRSAAITKRPGFARFNTEFAGGVILGGIPMPVAGFGGAPSSGGGAIVGTGDEDDGSSFGTGDMTGAPGATFGSDGPQGGDTPPVTTPEGAGQFNGGATLFGGARLIVIGRLGSDATVGQEGGSGWFVTSKNINDSANIQIPPGPPIAVYNFPPTAEFPAGWGTPSCIDNIGPTGLYYAAAYGDQVAGTQTPTIGFGPPGNPIRNTNGATDRLIATIPVSGDAGSDTLPPPDGDHRSAITDLHFGIDGFIYVTVKDRYQGQSRAGSSGRAFRLTPLTGELVSWNINRETGPNNHVPFCCAYFDGYLYVGRFPNLIDEQIGILKTNGPAFASDAEGSFGGSPAVGNNGGFPTAFATYNNRLFMGIGIWQTITNYASVFSRRIGPDDNGTGISAWGQSNTSFSTFDTGTPVGAAQNGNYIVSMEVFGDSLYVSWFNPGTNSKIFKVTANDFGNPDDPSVTVTEMVSGLNNIPHYLFADDEVLYAIGSNGSASSSSVFVTTDGAAWTEKTANLPAGATSSSMRPIFFGVDQ